MQKKNLRKIFLNHLENFDGDQLFNRGVVSLIIFGSYGADTANKYSDLDLCIVAEFEKETPPWERVNQFRDVLLPDGIVLGDITCFRKDEILHQFERGYGIALSIADDGEAVIDNGFFEIMRKEFAKLMLKGLKKTSMGYRLID